MGPWLHDCYLKCGPKTVNRQPQRSWDYSNADSMLRWLQVIFWQGERMMTSADRDVRCRCKRNPSNEARFRFWETQTGIVLTSMGLLGKPLKKSVLSWLQFQCVFPVLMPSSICGSMFLQNDAYQPCLSWVSVYQGNQVLSAEAHSTPV